MGAYRVTWEQSIRYEAEVIADSPADARAKAVFGRIHRPRIDWQSEPRSVAVVSIADLGMDSLFNVTHDLPDGAVGATHPSTSKDAARSASNRVRFNTQRYQVLECLSNHGPTTAAQIADRLGMARNQVATRLGECREAGHVAYVLTSSGAVLTARTSADSEGMVQEITTAGFEALRAARANRRG